MSNKSKAPAEGDRIDLGGKVPQFKAFTHFVYQELLKDNLEWVRIADVKVKKLDDIQFATTGEIHAYQMKWSNQAKPPAFSFLDFTKLLPEMISGWRALKKLHVKEDKILYVHIITNRKASVSDSVVDSNGVKIGSFADFIKQVYKPIRAGDKVNGAWKKLFDRLKNESGLSAKEFSEFWDVLRIEINFEIKLNKGSKPEDGQYNQDLKDLTNFIIEEIADKERKTHYTKDELLKTLNWHHRFKTTFKHEFFVDKDLYQPIESTAKALDKKVAKTTSGYIFLSGSPGAGKSTLLTQWSKVFANVVRYYAFSNTSISQNYNDRGESEKLFFDLVIQLNELKQVTTQAVLPHYSEVYLRGVFFKQLEDLSNDYKQTGKKTLIVIDGLDHIPREYETIKSLLSSLPPPASVPEGVIIILGSQTYELEGLQKDVKNLYLSGKQNVIIDFLTKKAVAAYITKYQPPVGLSKNQKERVFEISKGHPLQLTYLLEELASFPDEIDTILLREADYENINQYYQKIWDDISDDAKLKEMLGLMARVRGEINPKFVHEWGFLEEVKIKFYRKALHLFSRSYNSWVFFHNSFRQFIIKQTSLDGLTNEFSIKTDQGYHSKLAALYEKSIEEPKWNNLFHLYMSKNYDQFLREATGESFLQQLLEFRPVAKVRQDIRLGIQIADELQDHVILVRYLFLLSELFNRTFYFDPMGFVDQHLEIDNFAIAKNYMRDDHILHSSKQSAQSTAEDFFFCGEKDEAQKLYNLGYPDQVFDGKISLESDHEYEVAVKVVEKWASVAVLFEDVDKVLSIIKNTELIGTPSGMNRHDTVEHLKARLFYYAGSSLCQLEQWQKVEEILSGLNTADDYEAYVYVRLLQDMIGVARRKGNVGLRDKYFEWVTGKFAPSDVTDSIKLLIAQIIFRHNKDVRAVEVWIKDIPQPEVDYHSLSQKRDLDDYRFRMSLTMLRCSIGQRDNPHVVIPRPVDPRDRMTAQFERMLMLMSQLRSDALLSKRSSDFDEVIETITTFYYQNFSPTMSNWYTLESMRKSYFGELIEVISLFGVDDLAKFKDYLLADFKEYPQYWPSVKKKDVLFEFINRGIDKKELIPMILENEKTMFSRMDMAGRVDESRNEVKSWIRIEEPERAKEWMRKAIQESLSIGYRKDYQLNTWMDWLERVNMVEPEKAEERLHLYLSRLSYVKDMTENRPFFAASKGLLRVIYYWNYGTGVRTHIYLIEKGLIHYEDALAVFVRGSLKNAPIEALSMIIDLFTEILLNVSEEAHTELLREILEKVWQRRETLDVLEVVLSITTNIRKNALDTTRDQYFSEILRFGKVTGVDISKLEIPKGIKPATEKFEYSNYLNLSDGTPQLSEEEVLKQVKGFDSLKELFDLEAGVNSHFKWDRVFERVGDKLTAENIQTLASTLPNRYQPSEIYHLLSVAAFKIGKLDLARDLANSAIEYSSSSGWLKYHDGGTRINGFKDLSNVEGEVAIRKAFSAFANDIVATNYPSSYTESIEDILEVIVKEMNLKEVYKEIHHHVENLLSNADVDPDARVVLKALDPDFNKYLFQFLHYLAHTPASSIMYSTRRYLAIHAPQFDEALLSSLSVGSEQDQELFIDILTVNKANTKFVDKFKQQLELLVESPNFTIQRGAMQLGGSSP
jgi:hypothetical protein